MFAYTYIYIHVTNTSEKSINSIDAFTCVSYFLMFLNSSQIEKWKKNICRMYCVIWKVIFSIFLFYYFLFLFLNMYLKQSIAHKIWMQKIAKLFKNKITHEVTSYSSFNSSIDSIYIVICAHDWYSLILRIK